MNQSTKPCEFAFSSLMVRLRTVEKVYLSPNGAVTFRGAFGKAFRNIECRMPQLDCRECFLQSQCLFYRYCMRSNPGGKHPVKPYIFEAPDGGPGVVEPGKAVSFIITLVGEAVEKLELFLAIFEEMGRCGLGKIRGRCYLDEVYSISDDDYTPVYLKSSGHKILNSPVKRSWSEFCEPLDRDIERIRVQFLTPARIQNQGRLVDELPFHVLAIRLINRILDIDMEYCGGGLNFPVQDLVKKAEKEVYVRTQNIRWYDWSRYSLHQNTKMKLGGIVGEIEYQGNITLFIPFLLLGEYIHVGKQSTFGNGTIKVDVLL